jgi:hypothetical protein
MTSKHQGKELIKEQILQIPNCNFHYTYFQLPTGGREYFRVPTGWAATGLTTAAWLTREMSSQPSEKPGLAQTFARLISKVWIGLGELHWHM